jgi:hypothetical protein
MKCISGGGVQGDAAALLIAVSRNDVDVLLLLLQANLTSIPWESNDALQLPLSRLLLLSPPKVDDDDCMYSMESDSTSAKTQSTSSHWALTVASPKECLLLDQIANGCLYSPRQLHRAIEAAVTAGLKEVNIFFSSGRYI